MPTILLQPSGDTYVSQWYSNQNFSQSKYLCVGFGCRGRNEALIRFDLDLPPNAEIIRAVLMLHLHDIENANEVFIGVNRILDDYDNATVTWNTTPSYAPVSGSFRVSCRDAGKCVQADITELVREWAEDSYPNYGLALTGDPRRRGVAIFLSSNNDYGEPRLAVTFCCRDIGPTGPTGATGPTGPTGATGASLTGADGCYRAAGHSGRADRANGCNGSGWRDGTDRCNRRIANRANGCNRRRWRDGANGCNRRIADRACGRDGANGSRWRDRANGCNRRIPDRAYGRDGCNRADRAYGRDGCDRAHRGIAAITRRSVAVGHG